MYCHCHFVLSAKEVFLCSNYQLGHTKVFIVRRGPLRTVCYIEVSPFIIKILYETDPFPEKCPPEGAVRFIERFHCNTPLRK